VVAAQTKALGLDPKFRDGGRYQGNAISLIYKYLYRMCMTNEAD